MTEAISSDNYVIVLKLMYKLGNKQKYHTTSILEISSLKNSWSKDLSTYYNYEFG